MLLLYVFIVVQLLWCRWALKLTDQFWADYWEAQPPVVVIKGETEAREWPKARVVR